MQKWIKGLEIRPQVQLLHVVCDITTRVVSHTVVLLELYFLYFKSMTVVVLDVVERQSLTLWSSNSNRAIRYIKFPKQIGWLDCSQTTIINLV